MAEIMHNDNLKACRNIRRKNIEKYMNNGWSFGKKVYK